MPPHVAGHLGVFIGGPHIAGKTSKARERYAWTLRHEPKSDILSIEDQNSKQQKPIKPTIFFREEDAAQVSFLHNDPLVNTVQIENMTIARCMVDDRASPNILFKSKYQQMGLQLIDLPPCNQVENGFFDQGIAPVGPTGPQGPEGDNNLALSKAKKEKMPAKSQKKEPSKGQ
uniref:Uncharacterized protein n=1 Tax=Cannabis sativa TaxID=3483 RepID=A0A803QHM9_CANSA